MTRKRLGGSRLFSFSKIMNWLQMKWFCSSWCFVAVLRSSFIEIKVYFPARVLRRSSKVLLAFLMRINKQTVYTSLTITGLNNCRPAPFFAAQFLSRNYHATPDQFLHVHGDSAWKRYFFRLLGPVVRTAVSANPGLNFNPKCFIFSSKALSRIIFSILFRVSNHQIVGKEN